MKLSVDVVARSQEVPVPNPTGGKAPTGGVILGTIESTLTMLSQLLAYSRSNKHQASTLGRSGTAAMCKL